MKVRSGISSILALAAVLTVGTGCSKKDAALPSGGRPGGPGAGIPVEAVVIRPQPLENKIGVTGTLLANEEVELRSEISGRVTGIFFSEGSRVTKGAVLLTINDQDLQAQLKRKEFELALASDEERRQRALLDISGVSRETYDRSYNNMKMVEADRDLLETQIAKCKIVAPFDGVIGLRYVSEGGYVSPNSLAASMQDVDPMKVEFAVPEKYGRLIQKGTPVRVEVGDASDAYDGTVYAVESKVDPDTRTIKARAIIANPGQSLLPGSFARVGITLEKLTNAIVIPAQAIVPELGGEKVFVSVNGIARSRPIKTGVRAERSTQIIEGLSPNDTLIVTGLLQIADGSAVRLSLPTSPDEVTP